MYANVFNIQHFSLDDGPGIRTVVFFKGCPLDCVWCHNPESKESKPELLYHTEKCTYCQRCANVCSEKVHIVSKNSHKTDRHLCKFCGKCVENCYIGALEMVGKTYTIDEVMKEIAKDDVFFADGGGVTFSGGEPFLQFDVLYELLKQCRQKGYSTCIETSGFTSAENIKKAAMFTDWFLYDCKETDRDRHKKYTGQDNVLILENLFVLDEADAKVILRCPVIPKVNDYAAHFEKVAALANKHKCIKSVEFMPYHPLGIAKAYQLGKKTVYEEKEFMDKNKLLEYADITRKRTDKPITIK